MTIKEILKTFGIVFGGLVGFGVFYFFSSIFIWVIFENSLLSEFWRYTPIYFLILFCGWIVNYAITPQHKIDDVREK